MCSWLWLWLSPKVKEHLRIGQYLGMREQLHPWDPKGPFLKSAELASVEEGWSQERKQQSRSGEVMWL